MQHVILHATKNAYVVIVEGRYLAIFLEVDFVYSYIGFVFAGENILLHEGKVGSVLQVLLQAQTIA